MAPTIPSRNPLATAGPAEPVPESRGASPRSPGSRRRVLLPVASLAAIVHAFAPAPAAAQEAGEAAGPEPAYQSVEWRNIGPYRGGRAVAVHGVPTRPATFYMGATGGGVWKTTDAGETWRNVSDGHFNTSSVGAIAVAESDPNVVYVGMGEHPVRGVMTSHGDGVYRSTDAGETWTHLGLENTRHISRIRVHPDDPDRVYVAAQGAVHGPTEDRGIYRSLDGGESWEKVLYVNETAGASDLAMDMTNPRILYAAFWDHLRRPWQVRSGGPGSGFWKSTDGGETWSEINRGLPDRIGKLGIDVSRANPDRLYAIVEAEPDRGGLYRSDDAGRSWRHVNDARVIQTRSWYYMEVFAHPTDENTVYVLNAPVSRSYDAGESFRQIPVGHGDTHDLWINPLEPDRMALADDGGAEITGNEGASWSTLRNQPTAQFYRVNADNQFPYHVYGGQQDNSAIGIASASAGGIGWQDFYSVAGCESAYLAFDPDDPRYILGNCYQGLLDRWDRETGRAKPVQPYPFLGLAVDPVDHPYRFNWNAPVVTDPHDPSVTYFAGNVVFRTDDRGQSWDSISPDLTRDEEEKQGPGGVPITNEGAGGEVYNTIMYLEPSPLEEGVLWAGSDDGLVHLTRDGGGEWRDVTPPELEEGMINSIESSPHDPAKAYVVFTRYKFDDFTPHIYRTTDYGQSWTRVVDGIDAPGAWVRVVREDPAREGLLYAGTEVGMYLSYDDGASWEAWQLDLPVVPVTDLMVHQGDLVAATQGRSFWILDELGPVRQWNPSVADAAVHLFRPQETVRVSWGGGFGGGGSTTGENPPSGVPIHMSFASAPDTLVTLEVLTPAGQAVRTYASDPEAAGDEDFDRLPELEAGLNRVVWDFRHQAPTIVEGLTIFGNTSGRMAVPGAYQIRLTVGGTVATTDVRIVQDPRWDATPAQHREQDRFVATVHGLVDELYASVKEGRRIREQVEGVVARARRMEGADTVVSAGESLVEGLKEWETTVIQPRTTNFQDIINFRNKLDAQLLHLSSSVDGTEPPVTEGARERLPDLRDAWAERRAAFDDLVTRVDDFEALVREEEVPAVVGGG